MKKKIILITGSSGFLGNFFLIDGLKKGHHIVDILRSKNRKNKNLNSIRKQFPRTYRSIYYSKYKDLEKKLKNQKFDYFIHFATFYKNTHHNKEIPSFLETNITFPSIILDLVFRKIKKFINFGTMMQHVDGNNYVSKNFYASSKSAFETISNYYFYQNKKLKFYNLKFYESFAEADKRNKLIPTIFKNFRNNKTTKIISKNLQLNILHRIDIINAVHLILNNRINNGNYCLRYTKNTNIKKLISKINYKLKKKIKVKFLSNITLKPQKSFLKILPNWKPTINVEKLIQNKFLNENN